MPVKNECLNNIKFYLHRRGVRTNTGVDVLVSLISSSLTSIDVVLQSVLLLLVLRLLLVRFFLRFGLRFMLSRLGFLLANVIGRQRLISLQVCINLLLVCKHLINSHCSNLLLINSH